MQAKRVVVLHSKPSIDPNKMAAGKSTSFDGSMLSTFSSDSEALDALRESPAYELEAPSFGVKLVKPFETEAVITSSAMPSKNWGVDAIGADCRYDGSGVTVAVLDTGIHRRHPAFKEIEIIEEDFTGEGNGDKNGHGTHCAGTICGRDVNGSRIGIARGVKRLLIGKVLGAEGGGGTDAIADAMYWALKNGAHVISMSLGMDFPGYQEALEKQGWPKNVATSMALEGYRDNVRLFDRIAALINAGEFVGRQAIVVAAAGNESRRDKARSFKIAKSPPANADGFLSVGAIQMTNDAEKPFAVATFSNTKPNLAAPGVDILSAKNSDDGGLVSLSGTSMATPHVAGVAALWAQKSLIENGEVRVADVTANLLHFAKMTNGLSRDDVGKGVVQAPR